MDSELGGLLIAAIISVLLITGLVIGGNMMNAKSCQKLSQKTGMETEYSFIGGCYIKTEKGFIPSDSWRVVD